MCIGGENNGGEEWVLEGFVDIEEKATLTALAEAIVETHVYVFLKFPSIAESEVGQDVSASDFTKLWEHGACSNPGGDGVTFPYMLSEFNGGLYHVLAQRHAMVAYRR